MDESRFVPDPVSSEPPDVSDLRCSDCHQLRRSLPRHTSGCRYAGQNCPGCAYAAEGHIASCPIASQLKLPTDDCCEGVDLPSIGHAHSPDCANPRRVVRASYTLPSAAATKHADGCTNAGAASECDYCSRATTPAPVAAAEELAIAEATKAYAAEAGQERHADLLGQLVFASRSLAQSRIAELPNANEVVKSFCLDCRRYVEVAPHAKHCRAGRVLSVLLDLTANVEANRKTVVCGVDPDAPLETVTGRPGAIARYCQKCGAEDREWHAVQRPGVEVHLDCLGLNQCVGAGIGGKGHTLYTHQCAMRPNGGAR